MKIDFISARNRLRVLAAIAAVALVSGTGSAWADVDVEGENNTTGADSVNDNTYDIDDTVDLDVTNDSDVDNDVDLDIESGDNTVEDNTTVEDIMGGDIDVMGEFINELNSGDMDLSLSSMGDVDASFGNDTTGADSTNTNDLDVDRTFDFTLNNDADIDNDIEADLNSGDNTVEDNTTVGDFTTGDIEFDVNVENVANGSGAGIELPDFSDMSVSSDFTNDTTGSGSTNTNDVTVTDTVTIDVTNTADVDNDLDVDGDSGNNDVARNTTVGDVTTGSQSYNFTFTNILN